MGSMTLRCWRGRISGSRWAVSRSRCGAGSCGCDPDGRRTIPIIDAIRISRGTIRAVKQNLIFAIGMKILLLILAFFGYVSMQDAIIAEYGRNADQYFKFILGHYALLIRRRQRLWQNRKRNGTTQRRRSDAVRGPKRTNAGNRQGQTERGNTEFRQGECSQKRRRQRKTRAWIIGICILIAAQLLSRECLFSETKEKISRRGQKLLEQGKYKEALGGVQYLFKKNIRAPMRTMYFIRRRQAEVSGMRILRIETNMTKPHRVLNKAADLGGEMTPALYNLDRDFGDESGRL